MAYLYLLVAFDLVDLVAFRMVEVAYLDLSVFFFTHERNTHLEIPQVENLDQHLEVEALDLVDLLQHTNL